MTAERCNLCGLALVEVEAVERGVCLPSCEEVAGLDAAFDRLVSGGMDELEAAHALPWPGPRLVDVCEIVGTDLAAIEAEVAAGPSAEPVGLIPCGAIEISGTFVDAAFELPCPAGPPTGIPDDADEEEREAQRQEVRALAREALERYWRDHGGEGGEA